MKKIITFTAILALSACSIGKGPDGFPKITDKQYELMKNPPIGLKIEIEKALPQSRAELLKAEAIAIKNGRKLTSQEMELARKVGVNHPEKIRVFITNDFPIDEESLGPGGKVVGLTMNYGIFLKPEVLPHRSAYLEVVTHEFAHVVQFETLGIDGMTRRFMIEKSVLGDKLIPIERDAIVAGNRVYDDPKTEYGY